MPMSRVEVGRWRAPAVAGLLACVLLGACAPMQGHPSSQAAPSSAPHDWRDATYRLTCDGLGPGEFTAKLVHGAAWVPADVGMTPYYDDFDVRFEAQATGDVNGDGKPDAVVLLQCSPQPSNGFVQEVQVFGADGSRIGVLPSPSTLPETTILAPVYDPAGLSVDHEDIVAAMKEYGPNDSHATGPSVPFTVRWHWNGTTFVRVP
jgi:hypothetical protein